MSESVTDGTKREGLSDYETTDRTGSQGHGTVNSFRHRRSYIRNTYRNQVNSNVQSNKSQSPSGEGEEVLAVSFPQNYEYDMNKKRRG